jgi:hypothetical protein
MDLPLKLFRLRGIMKKKFLKDSTETEPLWIGYMLVDILYILNVIQGAFLGKNAPYIFDGITTLALV